MSHKIQITITDSELKKLLDILKNKIKTNNLVYSYEANKLGIGYLDSFTEVPGQNRQQATRWLVQPTTKNKLVKFLLGHI